MLKLDLHHLQLAIFTLEVWELSI